MRRFFVEKDRINDNVAHILGEEAKHITKVLRLGRGDEVILFDEAGWEYRSKIINGDHKEIKADIIEKVFPQRDSSLG